jgi:hypothetical protein
VYGGTLEGDIAMLFSRDEAEEEIDLSHEAWTGDASAALDDFAAKVARAAPSRRRA